MSEFIPIICTFFAGCLAIKGDTWRKSEKGLRKVSLWGWLSFAVILGSSTYSVYKTWQSVKQKQEYQDTLSYIIGEEVVRSTDTLLEPFKMLYVDYHGGNFIPRENIKLSDLLEHDNLVKAQEACFELRPTNYMIIPDQGTWNDIFASHISSGLSRLEKLQRNYANQMDPKLNRAIYEIIENGYMSYYKNYEPRSERGSQIPKCAVAQFDGRHQQYLKLIQAIISANKHNQS